MPTDQRKRSGPRRPPVPERIERAALAMAKANPWYGDKRIAVMCRREAKRNPFHPSVTSRRLS